MNDSPIVLACENVTLGYEHKPLLEHLSLTVRAGDYLCIVGENGSGKSTLLRSLLGLLSPLAGKIDCPAQREGRLGYLPQQTPTQRDFPATVTEVVLSGFSNRRTRFFYTSEEKSKALMNMGKLGVLELQDRCYRELSGGQQQRVLLARALCAADRLLILDEPVTGLDPAATQDLYKTLRYLNDIEKMAVIMVTHDRNEAYNMSREIAVMDGGRLLTVNRTKALFADPGSVPAAMLTGCKNIAPAIKRGEHEVYVPDWGVSLTTAQPVGDDIKAIGIRAHYFNPSAPTNRHEIEYLDEMEEPFEWIIEFKFKSAAESAPSVWWRVTKDKRPQLFPAELGIAPANILLLY